MCIIVTKRPSSLVQYEVLELSLLQQWSENSGISLTGEMLPLITILFSVSKDVKVLCEI
jgi:hypothetical protein